MNACRRMASVAAAILLLTSGAGVRAQSAPAQRPTFRSAVDLVSVAAVVRDKHGHFVPGLTKDDFVVEENGVARPIEQFEAEESAPVRVALLFDVSGSMRLSSRIEEARQTARHVLAALRLAGPSTDEAAVLSFDMNLQSLQPFTTDPGAIESALARVAPYGQTSLYDAIAQTARRVADAAPGDRRRRAVVVLTDGVDTSSELTPAQVSAVASAIDVPVYVIALASPLDRSRADSDPGSAPGERESALRSLARWTGGDLFVTSAPAHQSIAARRIVDELRHQYVIAFSASRGGSWHALRVRVRGGKDMTVRARSGYVAGARSES